MTQESPGDAGSDGPARRVDGDEQVSATGTPAPEPETPEPQDEDDGSVTAKQIHRWKYEGGAVLPSD